MDLPSTIKVYSNWPLGYMKQRPIFHQVTILRRAGRADEAVHYDADAGWPHAGGHLHLPPHSAAGHRDSVGERYRRN